MKGSDVASASCPQEPSLAEAVAALEGVVRVADRATTEFDAARTVINRFKSNAARGSQFESANEQAIQKLIAMRAMGMSSTEIADAIGLGGGERSRKVDILTAFRVLRLAGVEIGPGRRIGQRGTDRRNRKPGSGRNLADAHSKSPSRPAMPKEEDTHG